MKNFSEFLNDFTDNPHGLQLWNKIPVGELKKFAEAVIKAHQEFTNGRWKLHCGVCGCLIPYEDAPGIQAHHFNVTCKDHRDFAEIFQIDIELERRNLPPRSFILEGFFD